MAAYADEENMLDGENLDETEKESNSSAEIQVEELEIEALGMEDIQAEGVKINDDEESTCLVDDADD